MDNFTYFLFHYSKERERSCGAVFLCLWTKSQGSMSKWMSRTLISFIPSVRWGWVTLGGAHGRQFWGMARKEKPGNTTSVFATHTFLILLLRLMTLPVNVLWNEWQIYSFMWLESAKYSMGYKASFRHVIICYEELWAPDRLSVLKQQAKTVQHNVLQMSFCNPS